jgi:hypothetical protein
MLKTLYKIQLKSKNPNGINLLQTVFTTKKVYYNIRYTLHNFFVNVEKYNICGLPDNIKLTPVNKIEEIIQQKIKLY